MAKAGRTKAKKPRSKPNQGGIVTTSDYMHATVRAGEVAATGGKRQVYAELLTRFVRYIRVAAMRNASGVAATPLRVYRKKSRTAFKTRRLGWREIRSLRKRIDADLFLSKTVGDTDNLEEVTDPAHPLVKLLLNPNRRMSGHDLIEQMQLFAELTGNGYAVTVNGDNDWPVEVWPLMAQFVEVVPDKEKFISGYRYGREWSDQQFFPVELVTHVKFPNPLDPYYGLGPLSAVVEEADLMQRFTDLAVAMIDNGVNPGMIVTLKGTSTSDERKEAEIKLNQRYSGAQKYGRSLVISGKDVQIDRNASGEKEMSFLQSARDTRDLIATAFDIPPALLTLDGGKLAQSGTDPNMAVWQRQALEPRCRRMQAKFNSQLLPSFRGALGDESLCVIFDDCVDVNYEADAQTQVSLYGAGIVTLNEARAELTLPPVDEGDEFKAPMPSPFDTTSPSGGEDPGNPTAQDPPSVPEDDKEEDDQPIEKAAKVVPIVKHSSYWLEPHVDACCQGRITKAANADDMETALRGLFDSLVGKVPPSVDPTKPFALSIGDPFAVQRAFQEIVSDGMLADFIAGYGEGLVSGRADDERIRIGLSDTARRFIDDYTVRLASEVNATLSDSIKTALRNGVEQGQTGVQIADNLRSVIGNPYTAERIARTELARAQNLGSVQAWKDLGTVTHQEWLLSGNPCPICVTLSRQIKQVPVGTPFVTLGQTITMADGNQFVADWEPIIAPPAHPNCRCTLAPVFGE